MFRVGYLDDEYDVLKSARRGFQKYDIELNPLVGIKDASNINMLIDCIIDGQLDCLMVDYDLMKLDSKLFGTRIIKELNSILPDFTCFLLTNYIDQGIRENLVQKMFIQDKSIFAEEDDSVEFKEFINKIKNSIECFRKRMEFNKEEYTVLLHKRKKGELVAQDEEKFLMLYHILKGYEYVDELPAILLKSNTQETLDNMLLALNEFKQSLRKEE